MKTIAAAGAALCLAFALTVAATAQRGPQPEAPPDSPSWAYGVPNTPVNRPPGERPAPDTSLKHVPGTDQGLTLQHIRDYWDVGDWFPGDHPPMPNVVVHGRQPHVRGCAMCHMPEGKGRPENAPVSGLPAAYIVQQLHDFKNGLRTSADPRKANTQQMIEGAQDMTDEEMQEAAKYFGSMKWTHWITVKEVAMVPKTRISGNVFFALPGNSCNPNYSFFQVGTRTQYNPVAQLDVGLDVYWTKLNTAYKGPASYGPNVVRPIVSLLDDQNVVSLIFRMQRNFYP